MTREIVVAPVSALGEEIMQRFAAMHRLAITQRGRFAFAVPGGSVASLFLPLLVTAPLDWGRTHVFWVDERAVPMEDPESNYGLARRLWLDAARLDPARVHPMPGEGRDLDAAARSAERDLVRILGDPPRLDVAILGVGPDGHVASLFPRHPALAERNRYVLAVEDAPKPPPRRLTLTLPALGAAHELWITATGAGKAAAIRAATRSPVGEAEREEQELPVALAARSGPPVTLFLDPEAASGLRSA